MFVIENKIANVVDDNEVEIEKGGEELQGHAAQEEGLQQQQQQELAYPKIRSPIPTPPRPNWLKVPHTNQLPGSPFDSIKTRLRSLNLATVCEEASCPNVGECWSGGTGTIMLLGDTCTRGCMFCDVKTSPSPGVVDPFEPLKAAKAVIEWGVNYIVITSVDRDDIEDGGAAHFAICVEVLKEKKGDSLFVECLVSDFGGSGDSVKTIVESGLDVYAHNIETVRRLTPFVRDPRADYDQSLASLRRAKECKPRGMWTKSSIMVGLGETKEEVVKTMRDLRDVGVDVLTVGQYLKPSEKHLTIVEYVKPEIFEEYKKIGEEQLGFKYVVSGPMVRSSYKAGEFFETYMESKYGEKHNDWRQEWKEGKL